MVLAINRQNDLVAPPTGTATNPSTKTQTKALATSSPTLSTASTPCGSGFQGHKRTRLRRRRLHKILKGVKPDELPVEQPTKFDFAINLKTARTLGIEIPNSTQLLADKVIE